MVTGAVVVTVTVTVCSPLEPSCREELDKLHVGDRFATGVMLQLRLTAPTKEPTGATARVNFAFCPAVTVCEPCDPEVNPTLKSGAATPTPVSATVCVLPVIAILPVRLPAAEGVNVTEIWQLLPAGSAVPHLFVSAKSPVAEMPDMLSGALPVFVNVVT